MTVRQHLVRALLWAIAAASPVGAPILGMIFLSVCPLDSTIEPDGPFAMTFTSCGLSQPIEHFYETTAWLPLVPVFVAGPFVGLALAMLWLVVGIVSVVLTIRHVFCAVWISTRRRAD